MIVVEDSADLLALWCPEGTVRKVPSTPASIPGGMTRGEWLAQALARLDWPLIDSAWDVSSLMLHREGDWYGVWLSFLESGEHWGWYVNFQEPYRRTERGIQTMDLALDIIAEPDRSSWRWKDEDEFALLIESRSDQRRDRSARPPGGRASDRPGSSATSRRSTAPGRGGGRIRRGGCPSFLTAGRSSDDRPR